MIRDKKPYKILVVEDNPGDFTIVEEFLAEKIAAPLIEQARNFRQASTILDDPATAFDIILLDLSLPDKSGHELVNEMLKKAPFCPIIILTGFTDIDFSIKSISLGISDYLLKDDLNAATLYKSVIYAMERKKIIRELKESEKRYSDLFHLNPQPMWVYNLHTLRFVQVNKAAIKHYGYTESAFLNMTVNDINYQDDTQKADSQENADGVMEAGPSKGNFLHKTKSGDIIDVEIYSTPLVVNDTKFRSVIIIDVTEKNIYEHRLLKAIIKTQEDERYEIGGELHDNVCQILATSQLSLGLLKDAVAPEGLLWFNQCKEYVGMALNEIRDLSHRLAPAFFNKSTLQEAFSVLFKTFNIDDKYEILLHFDDAVEKHHLPLEMKLNLYRVLQEQLRNIQKYANASLVSVEVIIDKGKLKMRISDNGSGFNLAAIKGGIGFANMKRRTELFSGKFDITASPGNGCEIRIAIPLQETYV